MKLKILLFSLAVVVSYNAARAQNTSYGGLIEPGTTAGDGMTGLYNAFFGHEAGLNSSGYFSTFIGYQSGLNSPGGDANTFLGYQSGYNNDGYFNTFIGAESGYSSPGGVQNTFVGRRSGYLNTTGYNNVFLAIESGYNNTTGSFNTFIGPYSGQDNQDGEYNIYMGYLSGFSTTSGNENIFLGHQSGTNHSGNNNLFLGYYTGQNSVGNDNIFIGYQSGLVGGGNNNIFMGNNSGALSDGGNNVFIGHESGVNSDGSDNIFMGTSSGGPSSSGNDNVFIGRSSGYENEGGNDNVFIGRNSGLSNTTGANNVAVGQGALNNNLTGNNNTAIGNNARTLQNNLINAIAIGNNALATASNSVRIGSSAVTSIGGYASWSNLSDGRFKKNIQENVPGLEFIEKLRPVSYEIDQPKLQAFLKEESVITQPARKAIGFVAQEVEQVVNDNNYVFTGVEKPQNKDSHYSIRYAEFVVPLTKAVQELSSMVEALQQENASLRDRIDALEGTSSNATDLSGSTDNSTQPKTTVDEFALYQNVPNPFDKTTTITAVVPESVQEAKIVIYNLQGLELESYPITNRGNISVEISAGRFPSGMYIYALIADDRVIDTKKMILTK